MRRATKAGIALLATCAAGIVGLVIVAATQERRLAFTLGVIPDRLATVVEPGQLACQRPIDVGGDFRSVQLIVATYFEPGPELPVVVRDLDGRTVSSGSVAPGYPDNSTQVAPLDRTIPAGSRVEVCVGNTGDVKAALYGGPPVASRTSDGTLDGVPIGTDIALVFFEPEPSSSLSLLPTMFERAALFRPGFVGAWTFWFLAALVVLVVPFLLHRALTAAERESEP